VSVPPKSFEDVFGCRPSVVVAAPGRVNLLGEHTDYNDGYVLPAAIPQKTRVAAGRSGAQFLLYAAAFGRCVEFTLESPPSESFARYVYGALRVLSDSIGGLPPLALHVASDVPMGVGLSSSAALEVAVLRAARAIAGISLDDAALALMAQRAEIEWAGVHCGIMDQMAASLADERHMLYLDTRTLEYRLLPLPDGDILIIDSGLPRSLAASGYNERRAQCEEAARRLGVKALRDVVDLYSVASLPDPWRRRARHVVTENSRVIAAASGVSAKTFGTLMNDSHASLRDDFEVSLPQLDRLVGILTAHDAVWGARLTGAGFGGACVALCRRGEGEAVGARAVAEYAKHGGAGRVLIPQAGS
jgi:galactokinase